MDIDGTIEMAIGYGHPCGRDTLKNDIVLLNIHGDGFFSMEMVVSPSSEVMICRMDGCWMAADNAGGRWDGRPMEDPDQRTPC